MFCVISGLFDWDRIDEGTFCDRFRGVPLRVFSEFMWQVYHRVAV